MDENLKQRLRAEYMRGDIDWLQVVHSLGQMGVAVDDAGEIADRWQRAKTRAFWLSTGRGGDGV